MKVKVGIEEVSVIVINFIKEILINMLPTHILSNNRSIFSLNQGIVIGVVSSRFCLFD